MTNLRNKNHFKDPLYTPSYSWDEVDPEAVSYMSMDPVSRAQWYLHALQPKERQKPGAVIIQELLDLLSEIGSRYCQRGARMQILREQFREVDWHHACMDRPEMRDWFNDDGVPR